MKSIMKHIKKLLLGAMVLFSLATINTGCKKVLGLELQENWDFQPVVLDPHINKTAWQFLKDRALGSTPSDTIFKRFYDGIIYSGIDTSLYLQSDKTFIFLHNDAIYRLSSNKITTDCYFGYYKTSANKTGVAWTDYPKEQVKNWLLYLIAEGNHTFGTVGVNLVETKTLLPANTDPLNPESKMYFNIMNDQNMKFRINNFIGTKRYTEARTAGILATNGPVHVVDRIVEFNQ
jgi:hypothetical protein